MFAVLGREWRLVCHAYSTYLAYHTQVIALDLEQVYDQAQAAVECGNIELLDRAVKDIMFYLDLVGLFEPSQNNLQAHSAAPCELVRDPIFRAKYSRAVSRKTGLADLDQPAQVRLRRQVFGEVQQQHCPALVCPSMRAIARYFAALTLREQARAQELWSAVAMGPWR